MCIIETERLYIRKRTENDYDYFKMLYGENGNGMLVQLYKKMPEMLEEAWNNMIEHCNDEMFLVFRKDTDEFCGQLELRDDDEDGKELGIDFLKDQQNKGFGTEAITGFSNWLYKERNYSELTIRIDPENKRSQHVFEKLGAIFIDQRSGLTPEMYALFDRYGIDKEGPYYYKLPLPV